MPARRTALGWAILAILLFVVAIVLLFLPQETEQPDAPTARTRPSPAGDPTVVDPSSPEIEPATPAPEERPLEAGPEAFGLRVRVVDEDAEPVDEARISLWCKDSSVSSVWSHAHPLESATKADGLCVIEDLPRGDYFLIVESPLYTGRRANASIPAADELVVRLKDAPHVTGKAYIRDRNHPLRFGTIRFADSLPDGSSRARLTSHPSVRTGDDASFAVGPFQLGERAVVLAHRDFQLEVVNVKLSAEAPVQDIEVIFKDGILVRGTLQNRPGALLPHEQIFWRRAGSLREDAIYVLAWSDAFALARSALVRLPKRGQVTNVLVVAMEGKDLSLRIEDLDGNSVGRIKVNLSQRADPPFAWEAHTDENGTLTAPRLPPGDYTITLLSRSGDYLSSQKFAWTGAGSPLTLRINPEPR